MIFIYNCFAGTHTSSIASAVHLKELPLDRIPEKEEFKNIDFFNKLDTKDMGKILFRGTDDEGNKVFTLGRGTSKVLIPCIENLITIFHNDYGFLEKVVLSNMSPTVPRVMSFGGFVSRGLGIGFIGDPFVLIGARQAYMTIVQVVDRTKKLASDMTGPVIVLENKPEK